ncbi:hypothetical protein POV27_06270 [Aureisphaera galaxeae]|nr:hypothetical protein [Aureisphaera galaxeae]MDC8003649.1 hypothetical protein [Aureisphaera galaxeae]
MKKIILVAGDDITIGGKSVFNSNTLLTPERDHERSHRTFYLRCRG